MPYRLQEPDYPQTGHYVHGVLEWDTPEEAECALQVVRDEVPSTDLTVVCVPGRKSLHINTPEIKELQIAWVDSLEMALAECVQALRTIKETPRVGAFGWEFQDLAVETLNRLQIPDDQLPTRCYFGEADAE